MIMIELITMAGVFIRFLILLQAKKRARSPEELVCNGDHACGQRKVPRVTHSQENLDPAQQEGLSEEGKQPVVRHVSEYLSITNTCILHIDILAPCFY